MHPSALKTKITTPRLAHTREFYVTCLGMRVVEEWREGDDVGCILALASDGSEALLEIYEGKGADATAGVGLQFRTEDLAGFRALLPAGTEVRGPIERPWGGTYLYLTDPTAFRSRFSRAASSVRFRPKADIGRAYLTLDSWRG